MSEERFNSKKCEEMNDQCSSGYNQSPINIVTKNTVTNGSLAANPLSLCGDDAYLRLKNNGTNISMTLCNNVNEDIECTNHFICNGPLENRYVFHECHFHWGKKDSKGSEHEIDDQKYDGELHMVHWNNEKYSTFADALKHPDGLCVLGILLKVENHAETDLNLKNIFKSFKHVRHSGEESVTRSIINLYGMLSGNIEHYFTYNGSLTTSPFTECVKWIVFKNPLAVTAADINYLYEVTGSNKDRSDDVQSEQNLCIHDNWRKCLPLNERKVEASF